MLFWDADNRLDSLTNGNGTVTMDYDYTGMRVKKTASSGTTLYPFSGVEITFDNGNEVFAKYFRVGNDIIAANKAGQKLFYHNDHLGGVNVITGQSGAWMQRIEYDLWGKVSRDEGSGDSRHRFTGKELDVESGLYYYGSKGGIERGQVRS